MYDWLKGRILPWLRLEDSEPHPPAGHDPHDMLRVERADAGFLRLRMLQWRLYALAWGAGITFLSIGLLVANPLLLLLVIPLIVVAVVKAATLYVTMRLDYEMRWYVITDRSLLIREGVWNVQELTITFANAQNVRVTQGPLERWFGFSTVEVETAGGGSSEAGTTSHRARLRGLADPQEVRDVILDLLRNTARRGLGDPDDLETPQVAPARAGSALPGGTAPANALMHEVWQEARGLREVLERGNRS